MELISSDEYYGILRNGSQWMLGGRSGIADGGK